MLVVLGLVSRVEAQPLADRVPADALVYVGWSGADSMGPGYAGSHLEAVLKESKFSELVNVSLPRLMQKLGAKAPEARKFAALASAIGGPMWRHPTAFYFGGLDIDPNAGPVPKIALVCDAGAEGPALAAQLKQVMANATPPFEIKVEEQGGVVAIAAGAKGWGAAQKPAAALQTATKFQSALAQVQKQPVAAVYIDVEGIVKLADQMMANAPQGPTWAKAKQILGLEGVRRFIWTAGFDQRDWMGQAFVDAPAPRRGAIPGMFDARPLSDEIVKAIPQTATVAAAGKFDLGGLVRGIRQAIAQFDPNAGQEVENGFAQIKQMIGLDLQTDLFDVLGEDWAVYVDPMAAGEGLLGFSLVNKAKDASKLEASLTKLEGTANGLLQQAMAENGMTVQFKEEKIAGGATLHEFAIPFVSPTWSVDHGNLYLGLYPQVVQGGVEQVSEGGKSILDNEDFVAVRKRLGNVPNASGFTFANLPKSAPEAYQQILMVLRIYVGMADMFGADSPAMLLPPLRKIMPHLAPAGSVSWVDAAGWHAKSVEPFPGSTMFTAGGGGQVLMAQQALLVSILLPSLNRARETANRVKCGSNMRQIGQGILLYSNENKGKYPPDLGTLVKTEELTAAVFACPSGQTTELPAFANKNEEANWVNVHSDYVYLGKGMNITAGPETIVLYEKPGAHGGQGMNMLFGDGHVEFQMMPNARKMIQDQEAGKKGAGGL
jgi:prepilin-type processing-associated H-X9-DG protein